MRRPNLHCSQVAVVMRSISKNIGLKQDSLPRTLFARLQGIDRVTALSSVYQHEVKQGMASGMTVARGSYMARVVKNACLNVTWEHCNSIWPGVCDCNRIVAPCDAGPLGQLCITACSNCVL